MWRVGEGTGNRKKQSGDLMEKTKFKKRGGPTILPSENLG